MIQIRLDTGDDGHAVKTVLKGVVSSGSFKVREFAVDEGDLDREDQIEVKTRCDSYDDYAKATTKIAETVMRRLRTMVYGVLREQQAVISARS